MLVDVEPGGADLAVLERRGERRGVDEGAARGVDQDRVRLHRLELGRADQVVRLGARRRVQADDVRALEQLLELDPLGGELALRLRLRRARGVEELARERADELGIA